MNNVDRVASLLHFSADPLRNFFFNVEIFRTRKIKLDSSSKLSVSVEKLVVSNEKYALAIF
jgi:hypothetical protein